MVDPESVEDYTPPSPRIEGVDGDLLDIYCGDDLPPIGAAVAIDGEESDRLYAVVQSHLGARRARAWLPVRPDWVEAGLEIEPTDETAAFIGADDSTITVVPDLIGPAQNGDLPLFSSPPEWDELSGRRSSLTTGIEPIDALSPLSAGGLNLVIDNSDETAAFFELARRTADELAPRRMLVAGRRHPTAFEIPEDFTSQSIQAGDDVRSQIAALQLVIALSTKLRETDRSLAVVELPDLDVPSPTATASGRGVQQPIADIVERLGRHLVSTKETELTSLVLLRPPQDHPGLSSIIDSLALGDADTTIFIDEEGRFDPDRSRSNAELDEPLRNKRNRFRKILELAASADEKSAIFGDQELTDEERRALDEVDELRPIIG